MKESFFYQGKRKGVGVFMGGEIGNLWKERVFILGQGSIDFEENYIGNEVLCVEEWNYIG